MIMISKEMCAYISEVASRNVASTKECGDLSTLYAQDILACHLVSVATATVDSVQAEHNINLFSSTLFSSYTVRNIASTFFFDALQLTFMFNTLRLASPLLSIHLLLSFEFNTKTTCNVIKRQHMTVYRT